MRAQSADGALNKWPPAVLSERAPAGPRAWAQEEAAVIAAFVPKVDLSVLYTEPLSLTPSPSSWPATQLPSPKLCS